MVKTRISLFIFVLGLALRLSFVFISQEYKSYSMPGDNATYRVFAERIIEQGPFVLDSDSSNLTSIVGPGLPWILAILIKIFGNSWIPVFVLNSIISSLICVLIYKLGKRSFGRTVGVYAGLWSCIYVLFITFVPSAGKDIWITFLFLLSIYGIVFISSYTKLGFKKHLYVAFFSFILTYLLHVDERYLVITPFLILLLIFYSYKKNQKCNIKIAIIFSVWIILFMSPWLIRNYIIFERPVILTVRTSPIIDKVLGYEPMIAKEHKSKRLSEYEIEKALIGDTISQFSKEQLEAINDGILPHPFTKSEQVISSFLIYWKPVDFLRSYSTYGFRFDGIWSTKHNLLVGLTYGILLPFFILGIILGVRKRNFYAYGLGFILVIHMLIHIIMIPYTRNRYRIPIDPIIILIAFYAIEYYYLKLKEKFSS